MEIRDVIGSLREKNLELVSMINALRLDIHVLQYRVSKIEYPFGRDVSRETEISNDYTQEQLPLADAPHPAQEGVGAPRERGGDQRPDHG